MANINLDLNEKIRLLYNETQTIKMLEENSKALKSSIISDMENLGIKNVKNIPIYSDDSDVKDSKTISLSLVEKTAISYDLNFVKEIIPESIEKILTVDSDNMEEFKALLKSYNLNGKQVNALVKVMKVKCNVNSSTIKKKLDKGEISHKDMAKIADINVVSKYVKFS